MSEARRGEAESSAVVVAVSRSPAHTLSKPNQAAIRLLVGLGVEGDVHAGEKVRHRYHVRKDPDRPNLCQVHLIHAELHDELRELGFDLSPGQMGENVTIRGVDMLGLPAGARLKLGAAALVVLTGLRTPCSQLNRVQAGLMAATRVRLGRRVCFKAGVMAVVLAGGEVRPGDPVRVELPAGPFRPLEPV
jgi:MOSC domain-containing protein YiiM